MEWPASGTAWDTRRLNPLALLRNHVADFNHGVRTRDWSLMLERFAEDAELVLEGLAAEPYAGVAAIREAYLEHPPDDEIELLDLWETAVGAAGEYGWLRAPGVRAGELRLTLVDGHVSRLVVTRD